MKPAAPRSGKSSAAKRPSARPNRLPKSGKGHGGASDDFPVSALKSLEKIKRKEFSNATKWAAWVRCGGRCEGYGIRYYGLCNAPIDVGCFQYDHRDNVWTSQNNSLENCQVLCLPCHKEKTKADLKQIAKTKRIIKKRMGLKKSRNPLPFGRGSKWRKKIDGTIVRRRSG